MIHPSQEVNVDLGHKEGVTRFKMKTRQCQCRLRNRLFVMPRFPLVRLLDLLVFPSHSTSFMFFKQVFDSKTGRQTFTDNYLHILSAEEEEARY